MACRAVLGVAVALLASCRTDEPAKTEQKAPPAAPAKTTKAAKPAPAPAPAVPRRDTAPPALPPTYSDFNPPGVPHLSGEVHDGESGLRYIDEVIGTGKAPEKGKRVTVHYSGWLTDGTKFDSSRDRDAPIAIPFGTGAVIKGWDLGLESMRAGGKRRLVIPADIAYGDRGAGEAIPPGAMLVFDVELVEVGD